MDRAEFTPLAAANAESGNCCLPQKARAFPKGFVDDEMSMDPRNFMLRLSIIRRFLDSAAPFGSQLVCPSITNNCSKEASWPRIARRGGCVRE